MLRGDVGSADPYLRTMELEDFDHRPGPWNSRLRGVFDLMGSLKDETGMASLVPSPAAIYDLRLESGSAEISRNALQTILWQKTGGLDGTLDRIRSLEYSRDPRTQELLRQLRTAYPSVSQLWAAAALEDRTLDRTELTAETDVVRAVEQLIDKYVAVPLALPLPPRVATIQSVFREYDALVEDNSNLDCDTMVHLLMTSASAIRRSS
jgi:hypothetical protein